MRSHQSGWIVALWLGLTPLVSLAEEPVVNPRPKRVLMDPNQLFPARRWCLLHGAPLHKEPNVASPVLSRLGFMEIVHLANGFPEKDTGSTPYRIESSRRSQNTDWALVVKPSATSPQDVDTLRGWVPRKYLIETLEAERDKETQIQKKAVVVSRAGTGGEAAGPVVPVLTLPDAPGDGSSLPAVKARQQLALYRLLFVYAEYAEWLLVSPDPVQSLSSPQGELQSNVFGWIPARRVARWNTRECFQWDRDTYVERARDPGRLFATPQAAIQYVKGQASPMDILEPDPRNTQGKVIRLAKDAMRFHLLLGPREAQQEGRDKTGSWSTSAKGTDGRPFTNQLFEIGTVLSNGRVNADFEREQGRLETLASESAETEILFVIDDTHSMHVAFLVVANIVEQIAEEVTRNRLAGSDVRVGICYYHDGDTPEQSVDVTTTRLSSIVEGAGLEQRIQELKNHEIFADPKNDRLERVYDGIAQGIDNAEFKTHSRKILILLGDCGEKGTSAASVEDLVSRLVPLEQSPIEFHAVQLKKPSKLVEYGRFQSQIESQIRPAYLDRLKKKYASTFEADNAPLQVQNLFTYQFVDTPPDVAEGELQQIVANVTAEIRKTVLSNVTAAREQGDRLRQAIRDFTASGSLDSEDITDAGIATRQFLQQILKDEGLEAYGKTPQLYNTTYAWEKNRSGQRQLRRMVLVNDKNVDQAIRTLTNLESKLREGRELATEQAMIQILANQIGSGADLPPHLTTDRDKALWLLKSLSFNSDLFTKLMNPTEYGRPTLKDYQDVFLKRRILEGLVARRQVTAADFRNVPRGTGGVQFSEWQLKQPLQNYPVLDRTFTRFYKTGAVTETWCYVDYEREWP